MNAIVGAQTVAVSSRRGVQAAARGLPALIPCRRQRVAQRAQAATASSRQEQVTVPCDRRRLSSLRNAARICTGRSTGCFFIPLTFLLWRPSQAEPKVAIRRSANDTGFSVSFDSPMAGPATALLSSPMALYLLAEETGYSQASYYTTLGLFLMSFPGLYSLIMRSPKAKVRGSTKRSCYMLGRQSRQPVAVRRAVRTPSLWLSRSRLSLLCSSSARPSRSRAPLPLTRRCPSTSARPRSSPTSSATTTR